MRVKSSMPSKVFIKGFRHELANRAFALLAVERMAERLGDDRRGVFWRTYLDLEHFNGPRYQAAAIRWGLHRPPGLLTRLKAWALSSVPLALHGALLTLVYRETVKYLAWLRELQHQGPANARAFLEYMVAQEELQVEMMRLALRGQYAQLVARADDFFLRYNGVMPIGDGSAALRQAG
ncbi:hypothetical protein [Pseudomonas tohonis]|uniref:hypothetical protein n=1 Tax=Pseudomonas tohonis TaxID=2725477 RepID=UPI0021DA447A|nr:hypothetical protein [Pseudomonas tohonis]UXY50610.1 hypothetical protein N9L84_16645 [Pseudomonas tohonis]